MDVVSTMLLLVVLFAGTHVGLASAPVRARLVAALGQWGFLCVFFAVAGATFSAATVYYADHRLDGPAGPALGSFALLRAPLLVAIVLGIVSMVAAFARYGRSPYALGGQGVRDPHGLERITRHPFFVGLALFATAHALLATHLITTVLMLGLATLALLGSLAQDRKLVRLRGAPFADYLAATSAVPFAAIVARRQKLVWSEMPLVHIVVGLALALLLSEIHDRIFAYRGVGVIAVVVGGAAQIALGTWLRERRAPRAARAIWEPHRRRDSHREGV